MTPVADAMCLVDDEKTDPRHQLRQLLVAERRVVEPLGRDQQHVDLVAVELREHISPLVRVRRVDRDRTHTRSLCRGDLVAHERQKGRDQHGGPRAAPAKEQGRDEVDRRLPPPGALHDERPAVIVDEGMNGLELAVVEVGVVAPDQGAQHIECLCPRGRRQGHALNPASCHRRGVRPPTGRLACRGANLYFAQMYKSEPHESDLAAQRTQPGSRREDGSESPRQRPTPLQDLGRFGCVVMALPRRTGGGDMTCSAGRRGATLVAKPRAGEDAP